MSEKSTRSRLAVGVTVCKKLELDSSGGAYGGRPGVLSCESVRRSEVGVSKKGLAAFAVGDKYVVNVGI